jgi:phosphatidylinositol-bisphosphatase
VYNTQEKCYHDYKCFFGDLNFRVDLPNLEVRELIEQRNYPRLQSQDQLLKIKLSDVILSKFQEGPLNFDPTYKYDANCEVYDTSQETRIPAWCDRVLFARDAQSKQHLISDKWGGDDTKASLPVYYNRRNSSFSDHRPVLAVYHTQIVKVDKIKKEALR